MSTLVTLLGDGSVTGYRADKLLHGLAEPGLAVREARRVLARRGRGVLVGQDWDTFVIDSDDPDLTRQLVHARADRMPSHESPADTGISCWTTVSLT